MKILKQKSNKSRIKMSLTYDEDVGTEPCYKLRTLVCNYISKSCVKNNDIQLYCNSYLWFSIMLCTCINKTVL